MPQPRGPPCRRPAQQSSGQDRAGGRCNAFASSHGARIIQTSRDSSVIRITGIAFEWIIAFGAVVRKPPVLTGEAGTRAGPGNRWRDGDGSLARPHRGDEIWLPAVAEEQMFAARGITLDRQTLASWMSRRLVAEAASHAVARHSDVLPAAVCRRDATAGSRSRPRQDQSLPVLGDRHR
jgi:hypothetical protein